MSKKLNSMPDYQARMPRFQHDLSQATMFTAAPSMLLPCYYHMLHLGDRLSYQQDLSCRLNPIMKPSVAPIDLHVDYFFVPLSVIYLPALNLFYQTDDLVSGIFNEKDASNNYLKNQRFPLMDYSSALKSIHDDSSHSGVNGNQVYAGIEYDNASFDCQGKAAFRLCDLLDLSPADLFVPTEDTEKCNPHSTPWFLCAYHAIYENYAAFRNTDREKRSYLYNIDKWYASPVEINDKSLFALHYVDAYKDYFNSIKVSPIGASVSMLGNNTGQYNPWNLLNKVNSYLYLGVSPQRSLDDASEASGYGPNYDDYGDPAAVSVTTYTNSGNYLSSACVRQLFMVDKLLRVVGRADKNYESQFLAHFGVKVPHDVLHNITHLGHDMLTLDPTPTISTADTYSSTSGAGSSLGEVGGQGYVRGLGRKRHFEAPCHGVFMAVFHAIPRYRYYAGVSKLHDLSSPDKFWQPEYDRKGMQPLFSYEVYRPSYDVATFGQLGELLGWQFAYEQFKRKYDRVTRAFSNQGDGTSTPATNSYAPWVLNKVPFMTTNLDQFKPISNENFPTIFNPDSYNALSFKALATDLNVLMEVPYQTTWISGLTYAKAHSLFYTDPLILDYRLTMKVSNFMSETGEPELGD